MEAMQPDGTFKAVEMVDIGSVVRISGKLFAVIVRDGYLHYAEVSV